MQIQIDPCDDLDKSYPFDIGDITKEIYNNISREDKLTILMILVTKEFGDAIIAARQKLGIPDKGWLSPEITGNLYGEKESEINDFFDLKKYGKIERKIENETNEIINRFGLWGKWSDSISELIRFGKFRPPEKYRLTNNKKFSNPVIEINFVDKSPNDFIEWIKNVWPQLSIHPDWMSNTEEMNEIHITKLKDGTSMGNINSVPQFSNLKEYVKMLRLRNIYKLSYGKISKRLKIIESDNNLSSDRRRVINTIKDLNKAILNSRVITTKRAFLRKSFGNLVPHN